MVTDGSSPPTLPRNLRGSLVLAGAGVLATLGGLAWDAVLHARSPDLAHHEGVLTLSSPAHLTLLLGVGAAVAGLVGAGWSLLRRGRARAGFVVGTVVVLSAAAATMTWAAGQDADNHRAVADGAGVAAGGGHVHGADAVGDTAATGTAHVHETGECRPTAAQQAAADKLIADTRAGTARFASLAGATAAGYRPVTPPALAVVHYVNLAYVDDGRELDPSHPESLVYVNTTHGPVLAGAMYLANQGDADPPQVGGCLTQWHTHTDLCFSIATQQVVDFTGPDGTCSAGQVHYVPPPMMHVWLVDVPGGPFAHDVDGPALARALSG